MLKKLDYTNGNIDKRLEEISQKVLSKCDTCKCLNKKQKKLLQTNGKHIFQNSAESFLLYHKKDKESCI